MDQRQFLLTAPGFDLCLSRDGVAYVLKALKVDKAMDAILAREGSAFAGFVAQDSGHEESGDADIDHAVHAGHDVNVVAALSHDGTPRDSRFLSAKNAGSE